MKKLVRKIRRRLGLSGRQDLLTEQSAFLLNELRNLGERLRRQQGGMADLPDGDARQTRSSFDSQWRDVPEGVAMPSDREFMQHIEPLICEMTALPAGWFTGKKVLDMGCGCGRFTYGLLSLGASVTACDQSPWALKRTSDLCRDHADRLTVRQVDLLGWDERLEFDLTFCFGVAHHTGNTYLAIRNVCRKVRPGGRFFLMVYGFPESLADFAEVNAYEEVRREVRNMSFAEKQAYLMKRFGPVEAHGWFDAVSPRINDLLSYEELYELLANLGFSNIRRTIPNRNHHVVADRLEIDKTGCGQ